MCSSSGKLQGSRQHRGPLVLCGKCSLQQLPGQKILCQVFRMESLIFITLMLCSRFPNNPWSYEACATPLPVAVGPIAPSAAFTAPVGPSYGQSIPSYGHPASGPISSGFGSSGYGSGFGNGYGSAGSLYGSNLGTLQPYGKWC